MVAVERAVFFGAAALCGLASLVHLPAIEYGSWALAVAWMMTYVRALRVGCTRTLIER